MRLGTFRRARTVVLHAGKRGHLTLTLPLTGSADGGSGDVQVTIVKVPVANRAHQ